MGVAGKANPPIRRSSHAHVGLVVCFFCLSGVSKLKVSLLDGGRAVKTDRQKREPAHSGEAGEAWFAVVSVAQSVSAFGC